MGRAADGGKDGRQGEHRAGGTCCPPESPWPPQPSMVPRRSGRLHRPGQRHFCFLLTGRLGHGVLPKDALLGEESLKQKPQGSSSTARNLCLKRPLPASGHIRTYCFPSLSSEVATPAGNVSEHEYLPQLQPPRPGKGPQLISGKASPLSALETPVMTSTSHGHPLSPASDGLRGSQVQPRRCVRKSTDSCPARIKRQIDAPAPSCLRQWREDSRPM